MNLVEHVVLERGRRRERTEAPPERHGGEPVGYLLGLEGGPHDRIGRQTELAEGPSQLLPQLERAVVAHLVQPGVGDAPLVEQQGLEMRWVHLGRVSLRVGPVGGAEHADVAGRVRERGGPLDGIEAVRRVEVVVLGERPLGLVAAPGVLQHDDVAVADETPGALDEPARLLSVRGALQQDREPGSGGDPVAHRHRDVAGVQHDVVGLRGLRRWADSQREHSQRRQRHHPERARRMVVTPRPAACNGP